MSSPNLVRLSSLPAADILTGTERVPVLQEGAPRSASIEQIRAGSGSGSPDPSLQAIADASGYGILEKQSPSDSDWGFRGLGTGAGAHLLRRADGDSRYVQAASIATVALTGNYDDLINAINKAVISAMEQRISDLENAVFGT